MVCWQAELGQLRDSSVRWLGLIPSLEQEKVRWVWSTGSDSDLKKRDTNQGVKVEQVGVWIVQCGRQIVIQPGEGMDFNGEGLVAGMKLLQSIWFRASCRALSVLFGGSKVLYPAASLPRCSAVTQS